MGQATLWPRAPAATGAGNSRHHTRQMWHSPGPRDGANTISRSLLLCSWTGGRGSSRAGHHLATTSLPLDGMRGQAAGMGSEGGTRRRDCPSAGRAHSQNPHLIPRQRVQIEMSLVLHTSRYGFTNQLTWGGRPTT